MSTFSTMYDHQVHAGSELGKQIAIQVIKQNPLLRFLPMRAVNGLLLQTEILESIPDLDFVSNLNEGYDPTKGEWVPKDFKLGTLRDRSQVDIAFDDLGLGYTMADEIIRQMAVTNMAMGHRYSEELFKGDEAVSTKGFDGLQKATNSLSAINVVSASSSPSGTANTSIYFIKLGEDGLLGLFNGSPTPLLSKLEGDTLVTGKNGKQFPAKVVDHKLVVGAYINPVGIGRMANIKAGNLPTLSLMNELDANMKNGYDLIVTGREGYRLLNDLSNNNLTPFVDSTSLSTGVTTYNGTPIIKTDFIELDEVAVA